MTHPPPDEISHSLGTYTPVFHAAQKILGDKARLYCEVLNFARLDPAIGYCYASVNTLAKRAGKNHKTARQELQALVTNGYLEAVRVLGSTTRYYPTVKLVNEAREAGLLTTPPKFTTPPDFGSTTPPDFGSTTPPDFGSTTPPDFGRQEKELRTIEKEKELSISSSNEWPELMDELSRCGNAAAAANDICQFYSAKKYTDRRAANIVRSHWRDVQSRQGIKNPTGLLLTKIYEDDSPTNGREKDWGHSSTPQQVG